MDGRETVMTVYSARCNIYISRLCYDVSVRLSVTEVHWRIIANLRFKFRSQFTVHCDRDACEHEHCTIYTCSSVGAREGIIAGKSGGIISRYAMLGPLVSNWRSEIVSRKPRMHAFCSPTSNQTFKRNNQQVT